MPSTFHFINVDSYDGHHEVYPEWDYALRRLENAERSRSLGAVRRQWRFGKWYEATIPLRYVSNSDSLLFNQWWGDQARLALVWDLDTSPETLYGHLINPEQPFAQLEKPYQDQWRGALFFGAENGAAKTSGSPLILDSSSYGLLDLNILA